MYLNGKMNTLKFARTEEKYLFNYTARQIPEPLNLL